MLGARISRREDDWELGCVDDFKIDNRYEQSQGGDVQLNEAFRLCGEALSPGCVVWIRPMIAGCHRSITAYSEAGHTWLDDPDPQSIITTGSAAPS